MSRFQVLSKCLNIFRYLFLVHDKEHQFLAIVPNFVRLFVLLLFSCFFPCTTLVSLSDMEY